MLEVLMKIGDKYHCEKSMIFVYLMLCGMLGGLAAEITRRVIELF